MSFNRRQILVTLATVIYFAVAPVLCAQDSPTREAPVQETAQQPSTPKAAGRQYFPGVDDQDTTDPSALTPDSLPLTGVQVPGLGSQEMRHSYFVPGIEYGNIIRSTALGQPGTSDWNTTSFVAADLSLFQRWSRAALGIDYSGGGTFSTDPVLGNSFYHQLQLVQGISWSRLRISFIDQFSYLPESQFGFGAGTSLAAAGVGGALGPSLPALQTNYQPSQSIYSTVGSRASNSATIEGALKVTPRGSLTMAASYGLLRFAEPGNVDTDDSILSLGYDYVLSKTSTIGAVYRFTDYSYIGQPQRIGDHSVQAAYGRKITGKTTMQVFIGPEFTKFRTPLNGSTSRTAVSGGANLTYMWSRSNFTVTYNHGLAGGSGVFTGSKSDQVQGNLTQKLSQLWTGTVNVGFSRNSGLGLAESTDLSPSFNTWFVGAGVQRQLGRTATFAVAYNAYVESLELPTCSGGGCTSFVQHQVSLSFQWHARPLVLH